MLSLQSFWANRRDIVVAVRTNRINTYPFPIHGASSSPVNINRARRHGRFYCGGTCMNRFLISLLLIFTLIAPVSPQLARDPKPTGPLNMLVLGDSIMWGEGLKPMHKSWHQVKLWLQQTTGREVIERIEAHSGAIIEPGETDDRLSASILRCMSNWTKRCELTATPPWSVSC